MTEIESLQQLLRTIPEVQLAILVGSRAHGKPTEHSDWDIAVRWVKGITGMQKLEQIEALREKIALTLAQSKEQIDIIDLAAARLTMRALVAEEGIALKGDDTLAWNHFLTQTWSELEDYYWRQQHAA